ncbi:MAG: hypothetical protein ACI8S6_001717 [Myxococcota bacterium]
MTAPPTRSILLRAGLGGVLGLLLLPGTALLLGISLGQSARDLEGADQISRWRDARTALRIARFSPLMWSAATAQEDALDHMLSSAYLIGAVDGTADEPEAHLRFLEARAAQASWRAELLVTRLRYGEVDAVLSAVKSDDDAMVAVAAALAAGDREALVRWLPRATGAPDALRLIAGLPVEAVDDAPLSRFLAAESLRRTGDLAAAAPLLDALRGETAPVGGLAHTAWMLAQPAVTEPPAASDAPGWMGGWLLAAARAPDPDTAEQAVAGALRCVEGQLPELVLPYAMLSAPWLPHPDLFDGAIAAVSGEAQQRLRLLQARAALQGMELARAQATLKGLGEAPLQAGLDSEALLLRVATRELAADLPGAMKYALLGEAMPLAADKMRFKLLRARLLLTGAQGEVERAEALSLLDNLRNYPLSPTLEAERTALLGLAVQQTGEPEPFSLAGVDAPGTLYIDDAAFRLWFARYVDEIAREPQPSAALAALRYWRAANQRGELLIEARLGPSTSPRAELVRAHLQFARRRLLDGDSGGWSHFTAVRALVADEPLRALLEHAAVPLAHPPDLTVTVADTAP